MVSHAVLEEYERVKARGQQDRKNNLSVYRNVTEARYVALHTDRRSQPRQ